MLAAHARLRRRDEFTRAVRGGRRAGRGSLVVHVVGPVTAATHAGSVTDAKPVTDAQPDADTLGADASPPDAVRRTGPVLAGTAGTRPDAGSTPGPSKAGFVVSRGVGNAVTRHRVARRLRHLVRDRLPLLPPGSHLVVRALPPAAERSSDVLGRDLDDALRRLGYASGGAA